ncbi:hypothetical protein KFL_001560140 [Klebsormidium nitens]|uniref:Uncharacterized protein n=1 Tax=Klebsormidium nitens TaxID=105231 RepID=A0A1Y1HYB6_KLENI|nr:hypothetical protein KFL_001560140 [Klebsormidium nitens]|eukprot:GAQ83645.1 hypothetical protein KFL_001560140 [Klebsormidium nitens]
MLHKGLQAQEIRQPRRPALHGLIDPSHFRDFQRRLREEVEASQQLKAATNDSQDPGPSSDPHPAGAHHPAAEQRFRRKRAESSRENSPTPVGTGMWAPSPDLSEKGNSEGSPPSPTEKMTSSFPVKGSGGAPGESMDVDGRPQPSSAHHSQASLDSDRQAPRLFGEDESQKAESEGEGEDIEGAEFESADETSDEETTQDRAMIDDAPLEEEREVVQHGRFNAAMETDSETEGFSEVLARLKRRAPDVATNPHKTSRRRRVLLSPSDSSGEEKDSPSPVRSQGVSAEHPPVPEEGSALGTDRPMLDDLPSAPEDDGWSDDLPPEPEDDGRPDLFDLSLEDDFARACVIVPRPRWASRQTVAADGAPTALDAAGLISLEPRTSPSGPSPAPWLPRAR